MLYDIPGIGEKTYNRLLHFFGDEESILNCLESKDLFELSKVPGISPKKALDIIRFYHLRKKGKSFQQILRTSSSEMMHEKIITTIVSYATSHTVKNQLRLLYPTTDIKEIEERKKYVLEAKEWVKNIKVDKEVFKRLLECDPTNFVLKDDSKVLIADDQDVYNSLVEYKVYCDVRFIEDSSQLSEFINNYFSVIYVYRNPTYDFLSSVESYSLDDFYLPEKILTELIRHRTLFLNAIRLNETCNTDFPNYEHMISELDNIGHETEDLKEKLKNIWEHANELEKRYNQILKEKIDKIELDKEVFLDMVRRSYEGSIEWNSVLPDFVEKLNRACSDMEEELVSYYGVMNDFELVERRYPIRFNPDALREYGNLVRKEIYRRESEERKKISMKYKSVLEEIPDMLKKIHELDLKFSLGCFALDYDLRDFELSDKSLGFKKARNLYIENPQPIDYGIGDYIEPNSKITVLTGANSGGKTTLLETLLQIQILSQMGLPVPCEQASIKIFDEIYYFARHKGSSDAGALENFLNMLMPLLKTKGSKLILADEIEAVTEPGAAAKLISGLINYLLKNKETYGVVVTHLGDDIRDKVSVRIDGIEAEGLNPDLSLKVDHNPKYNVIAKSTPELIVRKMHGLTKDSTEKEFLESILNYF